MTFWDFYQNNRVKLLSGIGAVNNALIGAAATGMLDGLLSVLAIKWLALIGFLINAWLVGIGFNNTSREKIADAIQEALKATPAPKETT